MGFGPPNATTQVTTTTTTTATAAQTQITARLLPTVIPNVPYAADRSEASCKPELVSLASAELLRLKSYVAGIASIRQRQGTYPKEYASFAITPTVQLSYLAAGTSFVLVLGDLAKASPADAPAIQALLGCGGIYFALTSDYRDRGIYVDPTAEPGSTEVLFSPSVGFYVVSYVATGSRALQPIPTVPPTAPFALRGSSQCAAETRAGAPPLLASLQQFVVQLDSGATAPPQPQGWTVTIHRSPADYWLSLVPDSDDLLRAVYDCAYVTYLNDRAAQSILGDASQQPVLGFSPKVGLFVRNKALFSVL